VLLPLVTGPESPARLLVATRPLRDVLEALSPAGPEILSLGPMDPADLRSLAEVSTSAAFPARRAVIRDTFAAALTSVLREGPAVPAAWIVRLYVAHVARRASSLGVEEARHLGRTVPRTASELLDLELAGRPDLWSHALAVLAHAKGHGMPVTVVARIVGRSATADAVRDIFREAAGYLDTDADRDGSTLYRLAREELADALRARHRGVSAGSVWTGLLRGPFPGQGWWEEAEPYVLRHALEHALDAGEADSLIEDAGFLVHADRSPDRLLSLLAGSPEALRMAAVHDAAAENAPPGLDGWRQVLAGTARRLGFPELAVRFRADTAHRTTPGAVLALTAVRGRPVLISGARTGEVRGWDLADRELLWTAGDPGPVTSIAVLETGGEPIAVRGGADGTLRAWGLDLARTLWTSRSAAPVAAVGVADGPRPVVVSGGSDGSLRLWDALTGQGLVKHRTLTVLGVHGAYNHRGQMGEDEAAELMAREWTARLRGAMGSPADRIDLRVAYWASRLSDAGAHVPSPGGEEAATPVTADLAEAFLASPFAAVSRSRNLAVHGLTGRLGGAFGPLAGALALRMAREADAYLSDESARRIRTREAVAQAVSRARPRVVLAHSLGGVIAYEALWAHPELQVDLLVTMGTPLGLRKAVARRLRPALVGGRGRRPPQVARWVDLNNRADVFGAVPLPPVFDGVESRSFSAGGSSAHALGTYLASPELASLLAEYLK
jgi:hypothetical protein